jgi:hypothetical protein
MFKFSVEMTGNGFFFPFFGKATIGRAQNIAQLNTGLSTATVSIALDAMMEQRTLAGT